MTYDTVFAAGRDAIVTVLEVEPGTATRETRLVEDLRCDALAPVEIVEECLLRIGDADLDDLRTAGEAVDYAVARLR